MERQQKQEGTAPQAPAIEGLLGMDEGVLLAQIGRIQAEARGDALELGAEGLANDLRELGSRVLDRFQRELYRLLCEDGPAGNADRQSLRDALALGDAAVVGALTGALVMLGCPPPAAPLVAALVVKRGINPVWQETCAWWGERLARPTG